MNRRLSRFQKSLKRRQELKHLDVTVNPIAVDNLGTGFPLYMNGIALGDSSIQRIGRRVFFRYLFFRLTVLMNGGPLTDNCNLVRIVLVADKLANGRTPTWSDPNTPLEFQDALSPLSLENPKRFRVVWETTATLSVGGPAIKFYKKNIKINRTATWFGNGNVIGDHMSEAHWLYVISDSSTEAHPVFEGHFRYRYSDM